MTGKKLFSDVAREEVVVDSSPATLVVPASGSTAAATSTACRTETLTENQEPHPQQDALPADDRRPRVPFNERSQLEKDLALARTLQEQARSLSHNYLSPPLANFGCRC